MASQIIEPKKSLFNQASALAGANKIAPTLGVFDEAKGVEGRVNRITNSDSPLMQTAATKAAQAANARGLNSSSLGIQAGQQAVIETATPIAQTDANLHQGQALANQSAANAAATANAGNEINAGLQGMGLDAQAETQAKSLMESARQFDTGQANSQSNFGQDLALKREQTSAQQSQFAQEFGLKSQQLAAQEAQSAQNLSLQGRQLDAQIAQFAQNLGLTEQELQMKKEQLSAADRQALAQLELQRSQLAQQQEQFNAKQAQDATLARLDADTKTKLSTLDAEWRSKLGGDQNITNSWGTMMQSIGNIQNNSALDEAAKRTLIQNTIGSFQAYASFYSKATGIDVGSLLDFQIAATPSTQEQQQIDAARTPAYRDESTGE